MLTIFDCDFTGFGPGSADSRVRHRSAYTRKRRYLGSALVTGKDNLGSACDQGQPDFTMPVKHRLVFQVKICFQTLTEILKKKLEDVSHLVGAPFHPDTGRPRTREVKVLRNSLRSTLSTYTTTFKDVAEIFDRNRMEMEDGKDRDETEELARRLESTYMETIAEVQEGVISLGVLLKYEVL